MKKRTLLDKILAVSVHESKGLAAPSLATPISCKQFFGHRLLVLSDRIKERSVHLLMAY